MKNILSTDIDGTLLGKPDALESFNATWRSLRKKKSAPILCYNTGRMLDEMLELIADRDLIEPDYIISGVGTGIYDFNKQTTIKAFSTILEEGWDRDKADEVVSRVTEATRQPKKYQAPYKTSWYLHNATDAQIAALNQALDEAGLDVNVVYSSSQDLDILPKYANKGNALSWLLKQLELPKTQAIVAGDTGNDSAMFRVKGVRGIVVGNAQPELHELTVGLDVHRATGACADGVLEGLLHYGIIDEVVAVDFQHTAELSDPTLHPNTRHLLRNTDDTPIDTEELEYLRLAYKKAVEGLKKNITPMGFSACSLEDNVTQGTDENYRSVWARDGSITVIGSLHLDDEEVKQCQRATLTTLIEHITTTGQVPANVSIDTLDADYSGVGGICSIDSGIWLIIAFFEYTNHHKDTAFLRENWDGLQRIMDWLSAQDANNDGLIEVPEAGDWTDLFGRSYNPLYDEVLWYRANICYGRMMETLGQWRMAGDYLRWASHIKRAILLKFWPSTQAQPGMEYSFADRQTSLGDTQYLLAQVTPFSFDWRCDVYGNILASLLDILDHEKAQRAFRFMWGTGVNSPLPVANLYPVVQAGDPDWKPYYTVNLLNLPHHYHNGGIWPFVGAMWVQFIHKLGLHNIALKELVKLAKLNESGIRHEWEFNEWAHGQTGNPMGKAYQAWSCAEFVKACHVLKIV